ncbi:MAG: PEP-CTERM sorting domain-containing protein, partial [Planctomycetia bacterium]|nr:PEP-CTERM sorting domain-containing protein [Planctomycetia bacterium]
FCGVMLVSWWCISPSCGENYNWIGSNGNWDEAANWDPNGVPGAGDAVNIGDGSSVTVSGEVAAHTILHGNLITSDDTVVSNMLVVHGNFSSSHRIQNNYLIQLSDAQAQFSASEVQNNDLFEVSGGGTVNISGAFTLGDASNDSWYTQFSNCGVVNVGSLAIGSNNSDITFVQLHGSVLTSRNESGNLVGGITVSETGTADLSKGTVAVGVWGIQFADSNTDYTLIENGVSALPANVSSNVYDLTISDDNLVATLKTDLTSTGVFGAVKPVDGADSLILYTNLEGTSFNLFLRDILSYNPSLDIQPGTDPSSILLSLAGMGDADSLIWDLSSFYPNAILSLTPLNPHPSVPEPASWLLLLIGTTILLLKRKIPHP